MICDNDDMKIVAILSLLICLSTQASFKLEPIVGYERVQKILPTPRSKDRLVVGLRAQYGPRLFALEGEATRSSDDETFSDQNLRLKEESYAFRAGFRSSFRLPFVNWFLRAGGQARKSKIEETRNGVVSNREPAVYVSPYAGTGLSINFRGMFTANAGITVVFTGRPQGSDREYVTTLGFGVRI